MKPNKPEPRYFEFIGTQPQDPNQIMSQIRMGLRKDWHGKPYKGDPKAWYKIDGVYFGKVRVLFDICFACGVAAPSLTLFGRALELMIGTTPLKKRRKGPLTCEYWCVCLHNAPSP